MMLGLGLWLWGLVACGPPLPTGPIKATAPEPWSPVRPELSSAPRFLRRAALDLTGHLPTPAALARVQADATVLDAEIALLLDDPGVTERMVHLLDERWHVRIEAMPVGPQDYGWETDLRYTLAREMAEEPLRLMARVVVEDASWDTIVTTDETMATPLLASVWPLERSLDSDGWAPARWTDHRPPVGVLASNGLWWRYNTTVFNHNRTRAAAVSRLLLCDDYLERTIEFESPSLTDVAGTAEAVRENESCLACHATLDPLAATLFGFWSYDLYDPLELSRYHPEREPLGEDFLQVAPAWFGTPVDGLISLGPLVVADTRFPRCAVETFAEGLWRRPLADGEDGDEDELVLLTVLFEAEGRRARPLLSALTATASYVGDLATDPPPEAIPRLLGPQQLHAILAEISGFSWLQDGEDQLDSDVTGLRVALGGVDGEEVTVPKRQPDANLVLAWRATAEAAGRHILVDLEAGDSALFPGVTDRTTPDDAAFAEALRDAWWWLTATPLDAETQDGLTALWWVGGADDPREGWAMLVAALLQDPLFVTY